MSAGERDAAAEPVSELVPGEVMPVYQTQPSTTTVAERSRLALEEGDHLGQRGRVADVAGEDDVGESRESRFWA